jgi:MoaA/NifB/PqqE/SkfB family radical SAM enzyme
MPSPGRQLRTIAPYMVNFVLGNAMCRKAAVSYARRYMHRKIVDEDHLYTRNIRYERYSLLSNLVGTVERALTNKNISPPVRKKVVDIFIGRVFLRKSNPAARLRAEEFRKEFAQDPPGFITISPGKKCNLNCTGCYAASAGQSTEKLEYDTVSRIVGDKTDSWGCFFTVISGGEPLLWKSDRKGIIDLCRDHPDNYFMMYTNGTLIDRDMAGAMREVGNLSPAISVEGFEVETDQRRGRGVYSKILEAMANLREAGVPFGISVTATRENADRILADEFVDFYFDVQGAVYGWLFQYMPIGRHKTLDLMVTPEQRRWMLQREKYLIHEKHVFLPDFWNGGVFSEGCLAAGRGGGYVYVDWNGNVSPCVFFPYTKNNIREIYSRGGTLNDALRSDLMVGIRRWQREYGYEKTGKEVRNLIAPCGIRDHYAFAREHILATHAEPIDADAAEAISDTEYYEGLVDYDNTFMRLTDPIWRKEFLGEDEGAISPPPPDQTSTADEPAHAVGVTV